MLLLTLGEINAMPRSLAREDNGFAALKRRGALISYCSTGWWSQDGKKFAEYGHQWTKAQPFADEATAAV